MDSLVKKLNYEFEYLEKYYGDAKQVQKMIEECPKCGCRLVLNHYSDQYSLLVQETAKCHSCEYKKQKTIHIIN